MLAEAEVRSEARRLRVVLTPQLQVRLESNHVHGADRLSDFSSLAALVALDLRSRHGVRGRPARHVEEHHTLDAADSSDQEVELVSLEHLRTLVLALPHERLINRLLTDIVHYLQRKRVTQQPRPSPNLTILPHHLLPIIVIIYLIECRWLLSCCHSSALYIY